MIAKIDCWTDSIDPELSIDFYRDLASAHARQGGELGRHVLSLIKKGDMAALCEYSVDYCVSGMTANHYYHLRQALAFFSKLEFLDIGIDKERAALDTFLEAESRCKLTNEAFRAWGKGEFQFHPDVDRVLSDATRFISQVLGPVPPLSRLQLRFGPGATTLTKKREASPRNKFRKGLACSDELLPLLHEVLGELAAWTDHLPFEEEEPTMEALPPLVVCGDTCVFREIDFMSIVLDAGAQSAEVLCRGSLPVQLMDEELSFALKNAKTHRTVSKPPPLNSLVQNGYGDYMSARLKRFGLDLKDQSLNQRLAREGSLTGALATLDLRSASDTIAIELVYHLLPVDWANALSACRCKYVTFRGERKRLEKFSSMGNGYTFPLESLIFWALAKASCDAGDSVNVYGDDIVLPSSKFGFLTEVLTSCGFVVNTQKSFHDGPFRESCGADWYRGFNIRPFYAKHVVSGESLFCLHNYYARSGQEEFRGIVENAIPEHLRLYGPDGVGDGVLLGPFERVQRATTERHGYSGFYFKMHKHGSVKEALSAHSTDMSHALYTTYRRAVEPFSKCGLNASSVGDLRNWRYPINKKHHNFLTRMGVLGEPIPFSKEPGFVETKATSLPGTDGSKVVLSYNLG